MKLTREEAEKIANAIIRADFRIYGIGHFDISYDEVVNLIMIIANSGEHLQDRLIRYYEILERKHMPILYAQQQIELARIRNFQELDQVKEK